jgi:tRNA/rRNA methyltransferase
MEDTFGRIKIILSHPDEAGNVGAICRAIKTMGITRLAIIGARDLDVAIVRRLSVHAFDVFERAERFDTLEEALEGSVLSAALTRRRGKKRKAFSILPEELAEKAGSIGEGTLALVFGNEEHGLSSGDVKLCNLAVHIPTSPEFPSLNLSHAVQIITYELYRRVKPAAPYQVIPRQRLDEITDAAALTLKSIGFFVLTGDEAMKEFIRDILGRASLSESEARRVKKLVTKIRNLSLKKRG